MNEWLKTGAVAGVAVLLVGLAMWTSPREVDPAAFGGQGEAFFPGFEDPNLATSLEVVEYDEARGLARPFKVHLKDGRYTIPSHHDYPADAKDRLKKTAAAIIELKKDSIRSERVDDHETLGVVDPLDEKASASKGHGTRVTLRDRNGVVLADIVIGKKADREGVRYARVPGQGRTYATRVKDEISARFSDWIETDLLKLDAQQIQKIQINSYTIDEVEGLIKDVHQLALEKEGDAGRFKLADLRAGEELDEARLGEMTRSLDDLKIAGVRPKPAGLAADLQAGETFRKSRENVLSLRRAGFFVTDKGLLSSEGEVVVQMKDGVTYALRFGEVLVGEGDEVTAGTPAKDEAAPAPSTPPVPARGTENRYLLLTVRFDASLLGPEPVAAAPTPEATDAEKKQAEEDHARKKREWQQKADDGRKRTQELAERFARWYYVIPAEPYGKLRLTRTDLVKAKEKPEPEPAPPVPPAPPPGTPPPPTPPAPPAPTPPAPPASPPPAPPAPPPESAPGTPPPSAPPAPATPSPSAPPAPSGPEKPPPAAPEKP